MPKSRVVTLLLKSFDSLNYASKDAVLFVGEEQQVSLVHMGAFVNHVFLC